MRLTWPGFVLGLLLNFIGCRHVACLDFNESAARLYLRYARISYCTAQHIERWDCGEDCEHAEVRNGTVSFGYMKNWSIQGYVARLPQSTSEISCIIAIRGSVDAKNYMADAEFWMKDWPFPTSCPGCRVHAGFADAYSELRKPLLEAIRAHRCERLAFTGHSLGGAMVTFASFEARAGWGLHVDEVWTFGKPRVGNDQFAERYVVAAEQQGSSIPMWRVVHYLDPVPRIPLRLGLGYLHEAREVWYDTRSSSSFKVCAFDPSNASVPYEDPTCSTSRTVWPCLPHADLDHNIYLNLSMHHVDLPLECSSDSPVEQILFA